MDFKKVKSLIKTKNLAFDLEGADEHEVRISNDVGNDDSWVTFTPSKYKSEEELAKRIDSYFT